MVAGSLGPVPPGRPATGRRSGLSSENVPAPAARASRRTAGVSAVRTAAASRPTIARLRVSFLSGVGGAARAIPAEGARPTPECRRSSSAVVCCRRDHATQPAPSACLQVAPRPAGRGYAQCSLSRDGAADEIPFHEHSGLHRLPASSRMIFVVSEAAGARPANTGSSRIPQHAPFPGLSDLTLACIGHA